jgi:hypothetical protein
MQVNKSNKSYYLSDDTVIVPDDRRSTVKSYDWRSSTSCYDGWLRPQHICKIGKVFKGINNASKEVTFLTNLEHF